ncbi:hypothetical protein [Acidithiobacillus marinus]|nr:hypothetical protein [Acidithiobacillus marinus]
MEALKASKPKRKDLKETCPMVEGEQLSINIHDGMKKRNGQNPRLTSQD